MIDFEPSEDQRIMCDAIGQFAKASLAAPVRTHEQAGEVSSEVRRAAWEMGLGGIALPSACGGQELGWTTAVMLEEILGQADAGAAFALPGPGALGTALMELAREEQRNAILAPYFAAGGEDAFGAVAWSEERPHADRPGMCTVAVPDGEGYRLDGSKAFVLNAGIARDYLVVAQIEPERGWSGLAAFVVPAQSPGLSVGDRYLTLGLDAARFAPLRLAGVKVGAETRVGPEDTAAMTSPLLRFFAKRSLVVGARALGTAQLAFDLAREYCDTRVAFGKPIGHFQAVAFTLAERLMDIESARWMLWRAAWAWDTGADEAECLGGSARAAAQAIETAMRAADDCVSLHGGAGFIRDVLAEKLMRDAKQLAVCAPTGAELDQLAGALAVGKVLDPAAVLPTPETQPIFT